MSNQKDELSQNTQFDQQRNPHDVFIAEGGDPDYQLLFAKAGFRIVPSVEAADIVCFTGGWDVNPNLYGEEVIAETSFSLDRDSSDMKVWRAAKDKFKVGICRGGQFLNVMNGGKMWQDVDMHGRPHDLIDQFTGRQVKVSSTHHQMFRPAQGFISVAEAREANYKKSETQSWRLKNDSSKLDNYFKRDFEVLFYPKTRSLCFQPHPEFQEDGNRDCRNYFYSVLRRCVDGTIEQEAARRKAENKGT